ncbi:MAG: nif-specific transcriptional activator NifA [Nitrospirota bacterium]
MGGKNESRNELNRKILELETLYEISKKLGSSLDLNITLHSIMEILSEKMKMRRGTLTLLRQGGRELSIEVAHGLSEKEKRRGIYRIGEGITGKVVETGQPIIVPDIGKEPLFLNRTRARDIKRENISFLCIPVKVKGESIGVLSVDHLFSDDDISFEEDIRVLTIISSLIGQAVKICSVVDQEKRKLIEKNLYLQGELRTKYRFSNIIARSQKMDDIYNTIEKVSQSRATVLIRGESGTGKELIARAIHYNSTRSGMAFIKLNCAALPDTLLESELFGHEKGAFTGATSLRKGRFELADRGTLFLDEIGDIPITTQIKLLRVLQEMKFERIGSGKTISVDVRIISATNRDLEKAVQEGRFREDLYYRLNVVPISLPPLRERIEDMPLLIEFFVDKYNAENNKNVRISKDAVDLMMRYDWPGNIRELQNCVERIIIMTERDIILPDDISHIAGIIVKPVIVDDVHDRYIIEQINHSDKDSISLSTEVESIEKRNISIALEKCGWVQAKAARMLGLTSRQIAYRIKKYNISLRTI